MCQARSAAAEASGPAFLGVRFFWLRTSWLDFGREPPINELARHASLAAAQCHSLPERTCERRIRQKAFRLPGFFVRTKLRSCEDPPFVLLTCSSRLRWPRFDSRRMPDSGNRQTAICNIHKS